MISHRTLVASALIAFVGGAVAGATLIEPEVVEVEVEKIVEVAGPIQTVEVEKIVEVEVPGPERTIEVEVPGPVEEVTPTVCFEALAEGYTLVGNYAGHLLDIYSAYDEADDLVDFGRAFERLIGESNTEDYNSDPFFEAGDACLLFDY